MKKLLSLFLAILLIFTALIPMSAAATSYEADYDVPIIRMRGNGGDLYNADGTQIYPMELDASTDEIIDSVAGVLFPHFFNGILFGQWDEYYDAFREAIEPIFADMVFDENGNPKNGSGIGEEDRIDNETSAVTDKKGYSVADRYHSKDYTYWYDWRATPYDVIDDLHAYITSIMSVTGAKQVSLDGLCLGSAFIWAYLEKYGEMGHIKNVLFNVGISEYTAASDLLSGKIKLDPAALQRFVNERVHPDSTSIGDLMEVEPLVNEILLTSFDLLNETGVTDAGIGLFEKLYAEIYEGLMPKVAEVTLALQPSYWACMTAEDYEIARDFVFGDEDSEMYQKYKNYIAKIDNYYKKVILKKDEIVAKCEAKGVHFGAISKYGFQYEYPFIERQDELADSKSLTKYSSYGATCAKIGETLSDEYIAKQTEAGLSKYISLDKQIDTSTARFKDSTWVIKNATHDNWDIGEDLAHQFLWGTKVTVENLESKADGKHYTRYMVYDSENTRDPEDGFDYALLVSMTEENCGVTQWEDVHYGNESNLYTKLASLFRWLTAIFRFITSKLK